MANDIGYDDKSLQQLFSDLSPRRRVQALKGGFRREANRVRRTAINNLRSSIKTDRELEKGVRAEVFKRAAGFRVTIGSKGSAKTKKPILIWAEGGTEERHTKPKKGTRRRADRMKSAHRTGRMRRYGFMAQTLDSVRDSVTDNIHAMVTDNVQRVAKKYGCK